MVLRNKFDTLVITPTLGKRIESLKKTVESVRIIGGERVKHILIAPKDACVLLKYNFPDLDIYEEPINCDSIYGALNHIVRLFVSQYEYFTYINDDDYWLPSFKLLFKVLDEQKDIDVAYGRVTYVNLENRVIGEQTSSPFYKSFNSLLSHNIILFTQQATLMRSGLIMSMKGFSNEYKLISDTHFWSKVIGLGVKFKYINILCAAYTLHNEQLSSNSKLQSDEHKKLIKELSICNNSLSSMLKVVFFRIYNWRIYLQRIVVTRKLKITVA